ncbi:hypothetical protein RhiirA4_487605 [Rhizophagus irregularis]|uniref:Uncharacterized protein n=1 Tax=Rhizophagus irregularis TaxID=588596 RepID=A0A2I1HSU7_9GLOM|nr:hypothetical protein RhiirA4_487605 [Rhizophagus irregularis]
MPEFHGSDEQDHEDFVDQFVAYINLANINDNARILQNVLDNSGIGANIGDIRAANAGAITGAVASFPNVPLGLAAGGRPTNAVPVAVNAGGGIPIILAGIRAGIREDIREEGVLGPPSSYLNYTPTPPINPNIAPQQQGISLEDMQKQSRMH